FCMVIDPEAASFPARPYALCPNCSYNKDPPSLAVLRRRWTEYSEKIDTNVKRIIKRAIPVLAMA
ncbi:hypothetical protein NPN13_24870, partial [Vibrio parahaemolyticus]|nr:hypothetical protein [Vibrio parahaemolyticus]